MTDTKKRKNIVVYLPQVYAEYISELRHSIERVGKERGYRLLFFTCFGDNSNIGIEEATNIRYDEGERSVFRLADPDAADGVLLLYDAFARSQYAEINNLIKNRYDCPVINFRTPMEIELDNVHNIYVDDREAFAEMIRHFIEKHHCTKVDLVTGPQDNPHSMFRLDIYKEVLEQNGLPEEIVFRQSCGCGANGGDEGGQYATKLSTELDKVLYLETAASAMVTMLANAKDLEEFTQCLQKYVLRETGFKSFTLCLADHWEQQLPLPGMSYGKSMCMIDMVMGIYKSRILEPQRFPACQLIPGVFVKDDDPVYIIPLHYLQYYMGYVVLQIDYDLVSNVNIKSWFIHLDSALENFRMKQRLHLVAEELERLYIRDTLTGLYNRRGLEKFGEKMCEDCVRNNEQFMIMEIDMDGLKQVNDQYGHEEGDVCITTIANAMMYAAKDREICIRSGGDEYVVIGKNYSDEKVEMYIKRFQEFIDSANESLNKPYKIGASLGYYMGVPDGKRTVENYLRIADDKMYENKKRRKAKSYPGVEIR